MLQFSVTNTTEQPQRIKRWRLSCDCLRLSQDQLQLAPKESTTIDCELDFRDISRFTGGVLLHVEAVLDSESIVPVTVIEVTVLPAESQGTR